MLVCCRPLAVDKGVAVVIVVVVVVVVVAVVAVAVFSLFTALKFQFTLLP
jgi:hypothetical protein